jgi:dTDP-D-glucose 4,6-dehydratase
MTVKFSAAKTFAVLLSAVAVVAVSLASPADAQQTKRKARVSDRDAVYGARCCRATASSPTTPFRPASPLPAAI